MPNRDGTGRLGKGKNCNAKEKADRAGRGGRGKGKGFMSITKKLLGKL